MTKKRTNQAKSLLLASALVLLAPLVVRAETKRPTPGFNLFSVEQDVEIGRQSAVEAERQLPMLNDRNVNLYLNKIIAKLAAQAPGARYPYAIKAVNDAAVNAFALPGGPMYVNRGLVQAARSEAELAGVLAHEMSHVALRHGTHQASKAYLGQAGLGILGGLLGRDGGNTAKIVNAVGGLGMNAVFLKFGRDAEYQADQLGAEIMAGAGYDPLAMATFFAFLRSEQGRDPGKVEQFFSDHPPSADRETRIRAQAGTLPRARAQDVGGFDGTKAALQRVSPASAAVARRLEPGNQGGRGQAAGSLDVRVAEPSSRFQRFQQRDGFFTVEHPDNWRAYPSQSGYAVTFAPEGGIVDTGNGQVAILYGVIVDHYAPFENEDRWSGSLGEATDDLVDQIVRSNSYLRAQDVQPRREQVDGATSVSVTLSGRSPITGQEERVTVVTRSLSDAHVLYALSIVPGSGYDSMAGTFTRMLRTLNVDDAAAHRGVEVRPDSRR